MVVDKGLEKDNNTPVTRQWAFIVSADTQICQVDIIIPNLQMS